MYVCVCVGVWDNSNRMVVREFRYLYLSLIKTLVVSLNTKKPHSPHLLLKMPKPGPRLQVYLMRLCVGRYKKEYQTTYTHTYLTPISLNRHVSVPLVHLCTTLFVFVRVLEGPDLSRQLVHVCLTRCREHKSFHEVAQILGMHCRIMIGRFPEHLHEGGLLGLQLHATPPLSYFRVGEDKTLSLGHAGILFPLARVHVSQLPRPVGQAGHTVALARTLGQESGLAVEVNKLRLHMGKPRDQTGANSNSNPYLKIQRSVT